ncbi:MAG: sigma-70 family RNA polymerase sigma factor, partial [Syntrophomonadaceae bacterium]|nr:sigma-70 family RNA polymerase sigma factor [Syntrophomonadaceae bacterium]
VYWIARKLHLENTSGREFDDLFQEGVIGLMKAIDDYDSKRGQFGAYATLHIRGSILRSITDKQRIIRVPSYMIQLINNYKKISKELEIVYQREPTALEISHKLEVPLKQVYEIENIINDPLSLNAIVGGEDDDITLEDTIPDSGPSVEDITESRVFIEQLKDGFKEKLPELEFESVRLYYGLDCPEHTLKELAEVLNKTIEQVRQSRDKGLRVLRQSSFIRELDERTTWIRSIDYSQPRVTGGLRTSPVERIVLEREELFNKIKRQN